MRSRAALVTGAAGGIGQAIARRLAEDGLRLVLVDRSLELLSPVVEELANNGHSAKAIGVDLADRKGLTNFFEQLDAAGEGIDVLVNNAGVSPKLDGRSFQSWEISPAVWQWVMEINLTIPFLLCRHCMPSMKHRGWGRVINMSSAGGRQGSKFASACYGASKTALIGLSRRLAVEVGPFGITVNCVAPGRIQTPLLRGQDEEGTTKRYLSRVPARRIGTPLDVAEVVSFLASDAAGYVVGATVDVNGGAFMG